MMASWDVCLSAAACCAGDACVVPCSPTSSGIRAGSGEESDESEREDEEDGGDREGKFVRMVIGSRVLRRRRVRRAVLAHLLKERADAGEESDEDDETIGDGPDLEREVARLLVGGRAIKRRRMRGALARSLRNGGDTD